LTWRTLAEQTVVYLEFFHRWDTPLDDSAAKSFSRLVRGSPDYATFKTLAPEGSEERAAPFRQRGLAG
jgi:hypothetical protein